MSTIEAVQRRIEQIIELESTMQAELQLQGQQIEARRLGAEAAEGLRRAELEAAEKMPI